MLKSRNAPVVIYLIGWVIVLISCAFYSPYVENYSIFFEMCSVCTMVGLGLSVGGSVVGRTKYSITGEMVIRPSALMVALAVIGCSLKVVDRTLIRTITDFDIGGSARMSRQSGGNPISIAAGLLLPFTAVYFMVFRQYSSLLMNALSRMPALLLFLDFLLTASRGTSLLCAILFFRPRNFKNFMLIGSVGVALSSLIYNIRSVNSGNSELGAQSSISQTSAFMQNIDITSFGQSVTESAPSVISETILHLAAYTSHSLSEAAFVYNNEPSLVLRPYFAVSQLASLYKILSIEMTDAIRSGLYYGFHGNCFLAFGHFGFIHGF